MAEAPEFLDDVGHAKVLTTDYADDTDKTNCEMEEGATAATARALSSRGGVLQLLNIGGDFRLEIPDFVERAFSKHREVAGVLRQDVRTVGFQDTLHPPHLFDGLIQLLGVFDHLASTSANRASRRAFQPAEIVIHVHLKFSDFIHRAFGEDGKIPGILWKHVHPQRLNGAAEVLDLFKGLLQLGFGLDHNFSLNMPLVRPGSNRICWKNRTYRQNSSESSHATRISKPCRRWFVRAP